MSPRCSLRSHAVSMYVATGLWLLAAGPGTRGGSFLHSHLSNLPVNIWIPGFVRGGKLVTILCPSSFQTPLCYPICRSPGPASTPVVFLYHLPGSGPPSSLQRLRGGWVTVKCRSRAVEASGVLHHRLFPASARSVVSGQRSARVPGGLQDLNTPHRYSELENSSLGLQSNAITNLWHCGI